jgi:hypothetical protein
MSNRHVIRDSEIFWVPVRSGRCNVSLLPICHVRVTAGLQLPVVRLCSAMISIAS